MKEARESGVMRGPVMGKGGVAEVRDGVFRIVAAGGSAPAEWVSVTVEAPVDSEQPWTMRLEFE